MIYTTASDTYATTPSTAQGRTLMGNSTSTQQRATMGVVIGSDVQAHDATLDGLSSVTTASGDMIYATASDTFTTTTTTTFGRSLFDDADASVARTTLGAITSGGTSTDTAIPRWNGTGGTALQDSSVLIDGSDNITGANDVTVGNDLTVTGNIDGITPVERSQLTNIDTTTISSSQWGYLGDMNQSVATTDTPSFNGLSAGSQKIIQVATPTISTDAANKSYVDNVAAVGLTPLSAAQYATAAVLPNSPSYASPAETLTATAAGQLVVDGQTITYSASPLVRILVKDQADDRENGVYVVTRDGWVEIGF